jgi:hypothetical protein
VDRDYDEVRSEGDKVDSTVLGNQFADWEYRIYGWMTSVIPKVEFWTGYRCVAVVVVTHLLRMSGLNIHPRQRTERSEKTGVWGRLPHEVRDDSLTGIFWDLTNVSWLGPSFLERKRTDGFPSA